MHEPREQWVQNWPGQVVLCVSQIYWTSYVHAALETAGPSLHDFYNSLQVRQPSLLVICFDYSFIHSFIHFVSDNMAYRVNAQRDNQTDRQTGE